jgi:hypothetical protein
MTHRTHRTHRHLAGAVCLRLVAAAAVLAAATPAAAAPAAECLQYVTQPDPVTQQPTLVCTRWSLPPGSPATPGTPGDDDEGDDGGGGFNAPGDTSCFWEAYPIPDGVVPDRPPGVSDRAVMYWELCVNEFGITYVQSPAQWFEPGEVPAPLPSPAQVATLLRVEVAASLRDPVVATDPPAADPSIIDVPTFVAVTNWQGEQVVPGCDDTGTVCVTITATPALTFAPGEPGAATVACEGGGTRFDRGGPLPDVQAEADGACAHAYARRTGARGRPDAWTASATITWDVAWRADDGSGSGTFTDISATTTFDRAVDELNTVITDTD